MRKTMPGAFNSAIKGHKSMRKFIIHCFISIITLFFVAGLFGCNAQKDNSQSLSRSEAISNCVAAFHTGLIKMSESFPQLKGVASAQPTSTAFVFEHGIMSRGKKEEPKYDNPNACSIRFRISDVAGQTNRTVAAAERYVPKLQLIFVFQCFANPENATTPAFKKAVDGVHRAAMLQLSKDISGKKEGPTKKFKVSGTNGGALRVRLANPYQGILYFSLKTMFRVLKLHGVLLKAPPFVSGTSSNK